VLLFSIPLTYALRHLDIKIYPNIDTCYYYDSKIAQKYLLEAINAPLVTTHVFYDRDKALEWFIKKAELPVVFKLSTGAGSENVMLIQSYGQGKSFIKKMFSRGFKGYSRLGPLKERVWHFLRDKNIASFVRISRGLYRMVIPNKTKMSLNIERDYLYTQEFIPDNDSDIRIYLVGARAYGMKRMVRKNDFRASGSGVRSCDASVIPIECVKLAFQVNSRLNAQTLAFDFVYSKSKPLIVEISYATVPKYYDDCGGFWDSSLNRHEGPFSISHQIIDDLMDQRDRDIETDITIEALHENQ
jgi:hypothetical protein